MQFSLLPSSGWRNCITVFKNTTTILESSKTPTFFLSLSFIWKAHCHGKRDKNRDPPLTSSLCQLPQQSELVQVEARSLELSPGLPCDSRGLNTPTIIQCLTRHHIGELGQKLSIPDLTQHYKVECCHKHHCVTQQSPRTPNVKWWGSFNWKIFI